LLALSFTVSVAVSVLKKLGVNVTLIVHKACGARLLPQVFVWLKSGLLRVMLEIFSATDWTFVKVMVAVSLGV